jgi:hypothetical protein
MPLGQDLTLDVLNNLMDRLGPPPARETILASPQMMGRFRELGKIQAGINSIINTCIDVIECPFLPTPGKRCPRRGQYRSRRGFKQAHNYWVKETRRMAKVAWLFTSPWIRSI